MLSLYSLALIVLHFYLINANPELVDWCKVEADRCNEKRHIACKTDEHFFRGNCTDVVVEGVSPDLRQTILNRHNYLRNVLAGGKIPGFPRASRMQKMKWSDDLAYLATTHVKQCNYEHDKCHATEKFQYAGQNIGRQESTVANNTADLRWVQVINRWFYEYRNVDPSIVDEYVTNTNPKIKIGHFTVMARENNSELGCDHISHKSIRDGIDRYGYIETCDYSDTNMKKMPLYTRGEPCSECASMNLKCSEKYKFLCTEMSDMETNPADGFSGDPRDPDGKEFFNGKEKSANPMKIIALILSAVTLIILEY